MKKKDILTILNANKKIKKLQRLVDYTILERPFSAPLEKKEHYWLSILDSFPPEQEILKREIKEAKAEYEKALTDKSICIHDVIIITTVGNGLYCYDAYDCAICNKRINEKNLSCDDIPKVFIRNKIQDDGDILYEYEEGMSLQEIKDHILSFINENDEEDEIDLTEAFLDLEEKDITIKYNNKQNKTLTKTI